MAGNLIVGSPIRALRTVIKRSFVHIVSTESELIKIDRYWYYARKLRYLGNNIILYLCQLLLPLLIHPHWHTQANEQPWRIEGKLWHIQDPLPRSISHKYLTRQLIKRKNIIFFSKKVMPSTEIRSFYKIQLSQCLPKQRASESPPNNNTDTRKATTYLPHLIQFWLGISVSIWLKQMDSNSGIKV